MSTTPEPTPTAAAQTARTIDLAFDFLRDALDDPAVLDRIPDGATVVMLPDDDPGLAAANLRLAERAAAEGKTVYVRPPAGPPVAAERWKGTRVRAFQIGALHLRWPTTPREGDPIITYDRPSDTLRILLAEAHGPVWDVPRNDLVAWLVNPTTGEVVGQEVRAFLARAVGQAPRLLHVLAVAELSGITPEEVARLRRQQGGDTAAGGTVGGTIAALREDLERLIA